MKSEKELNLLGQSYLKEHPEANYVLVAPDENVFLPSAENAAKAYAREKGFVLLKVTRSKDLAVISDATAAPIAEAGKPTKPKLSGKNAVKAPEAPAAVDKEETKAPTL